MLDYFYSLEMLVYLPLMIMLDNDSFEQLDMLADEENQ